MSNIHLNCLPRTLHVYRASDAALEFQYIDERFLPTELREVTTRSAQTICDAIACLGVRGAPALGIAGAAAVLLWMQEHSGYSRTELDRACEQIAHVRPTAVNLAWAVGNMQKQLHAWLDAALPPECIMQAAFDYVVALEEADVATNKRIGEVGAALLERGTRVLTHCNAGSLATAYYGTALGVVYAAAEQGKIAHVYADETRPLGQGSRLTVWELAQAGVPCTLQCDNMAASLMAQGQIDCVIVGADRIAANGDVANKIGTYNLAVLAAYHHIPFYVAAPLSTFDFTLSSGAGIPIEQRSATEVLPQAIEGVSVYNPAFDVTPAKLVTKIITEYGALSPENISELRKYTQ